MPIDYKNYPPNWKTEIRPAILARAKHCCELCGVKNHAIGLRGKKGNFYTEEDLNTNNGAIDDEYRLIKIVLTISHTNHDTSDNSPSNLRALCQRCHLMHDKEHHALMRRANRWRQQRGIAKGQGQMVFEELF